MPSTNTSNKRKFDDEVEPSSKKIKVVNKEQDSDNSDQENSTSNDKDIILSPADWRKKNNVSIEGTFQPDPFQKFTDYEFPKIFQHIFASFTSPTVIQGQSWPIILGGHDLVGLAATGSGKTLSFLLPALLKIISVPKRGYGATPLALVMAPTRELAQQIEEVCKTSVRGTSIRNLCAYGGLGKLDQSRILRNGVDIIIGTPGRLNDLLRSHHLATVQYLVLDEADRMLDMGFLPQIEALIDQIPSERQTLMFSATWPKEVKQLSTKFLKNPIKITVGNTELTGNINVTQHVINVNDLTESQKDEMIYEHMNKTLSESADSLVIVFCNEKYRCDDLQHFLKIAKGQNSIVLHSGKEQREREQGLRLFRTHKIPILIATDVAARGLDIPNVKAVFNYGFPNNIEDYVHRIGRTGRAGKTGDAYSYVSNATTNLGDLVKILQRTKQEIPEFLEKYSRNSRQGRSRYGGGGRGFGGGRGGRGGGRGFGGGNRGGNGGGFNNNNGGGFNNNNGGGDYNNGGNGGYSHGSNNNRSGGYGGNRGGNGGGYGGGRGGNNNSFKGNNSW
ncbi:hypothetical protein CYY_004572 [Polysphondylium violaceum]|uniref:RNA helicase n=1 Tax=Polysphondylium violaceum TaxID=133409 RepID=A0A8J4UZ65_9MYCE|nr:hypothetical protein CYY_004572 [Polysphondylium violaceum]